MNTEEQPRFISIRSHVEKVKTLLRTLGFRVDNCYANIFDTTEDLEQYKQDDAGFQYAMAHRCHTFTMGWNMAKVNDRIYLSKTVRNRIVYIEVVVSYQPELTQYNL